MTIPQNMLWNIYYRSGAVLDACNKMQVALDESYEEILELRKDIKRLEEIVRDIYERDLK